MIAGNRTLGRCKQSRMVGDLKCIITRFVFRFFTEELIAIKRFNIFIYRLGNILQIFLTKAHILRAFIITQFKCATKAWDGPAYYSKYRFGRICTCIAKHCS